MFATHLLDLAYKLDDMNKSSDLHTKLDSIVVTVDDATGERKYKIVKAMPSENSYADVVFNQFGIDEKDIITRAEKMKWN